MTRKQRTLYRLGRNRRGDSTHAPLCGRGRPIMPERIIHTLGGKRGGFLFIMGIGWLASGGKSSKGGAHGAVAF